MELTQLEVGQKLASEVGVKALPNDNRKLMAP